MKITKIKALLYKNIRVNLTLNADLVTLLVGQNGMGKSNLMELVLLIFDDLYMWASRRNVPDEEEMLPEYTIEYECRGQKYRAKKEGKFRYLWKIQEERNLWVEPRPTYDMLPSQIVAYYSGENKRERDMIAKHVKREEYSKRRHYSRGDNMALEPRKLLFAENRHSKFVLATLLLYQHHPVYRENIGKVLREVVHLTEWNVIHLRFSNHRSARMSELRKARHTLRDYRDMMLQGEYLYESNIFWGLRGRIDQLLRMLLVYVINHGLNYDITRSKNEGTEFFDIESVPNEDNFREVLYEEFPSPMDFLNTLEECYVLHMLDSKDALNISLKKEADEQYYSYVQLSEGEQQYLTVMGLIALTRNNESETLYLLDEPDTHINPQWQRTYIKQIEDLVGAGEEKERNTFFISTHSPLLVQAYNKELVDMLLFRRKGGLIEIDTHDYALDNWRIDQVLMSEYFDLPSSRPAYLDNFMRRRELAVKEMLDKNTQTSIEGETDEFGFLPTGETMTDVKAMAYIHKMAERLRREGHI